ncbi:universal stress protein [Sphingomonas sp. NPDC079357]|uniref:universal stress protein n=1 Tax=Sphingomonas sp. NPDC079357 TaxID=3364518 RepID=UPI00384BD1D2
MVEDVDKARSFIDATLTLVEFRHAHLVVELLAPVPLLSPASAPLGAVYALADEVEHRAWFTRADLLTRLPAECTAEVLTQVDGSAFLAGDLRRTAPVTDLVTVGPPESWTSDQLRQRTVEALLMFAGAPMLLLPPGRSVRRINHAVIGWKVGTPATRALRELVRLAAPGARIDVAVVTNETMPDLQGVTNYLGRHGFAAEPHVLAHDERTADTLQAFALDRGADLLAVGGYTHSRAREAIFGGVTRTLVDDPRTPVLIVH